MILFSLSEQNSCPECGLDQGMRVATELLIIRVSVKSQGYGQKRLQLSEQIAFHKKQFS